MSTAAAPNPKDLILLAGLGIGVYWFMSRRAMAGAGAVAPTSSRAAATYAWNDASLWGAVGKIIGAVSPSQVKDYQDAAGRASGPQPTGAGSYIGDEAVYLSSSAVDGLPVNPVSASPYDYAVTADRGWLDF